MRLLRWISLGLLIGIFPVVSFAQGQLPSVLVRESLSPIQIKGVSEGDISAPATSERVDRMASLAVASTGNMTYHGGSVQHNQKVYTIFWNPTGTPAFPTGYQTTINQFVQDLNGSAYYSIASQYSDTTGSISNVVTLSGTWLDTTNVIPNNPPSNSDLIAEVNRAKSANGWTSDANSYFQIYTPGGIGTSATYCGFHLTSSTPVGLILFPANKDDGLHGCFAGGPYPNSQAIDSAITSSAHEIMETLTDPFGSGWYADTLDDGEIADPCSFSFGSRASDGSNMTLNGHKYVVQQLWSNSVSGCTLTSISPAILTVTRNGTGSGTVTSNLGGINCGPTCSATFPIGQPVLLTATPAAGSAFVSWSGDADCSDGTLTLSTNLSCTATFALLPKITNITPPSGAIGTSVSATITGTNLTGATSVAFSGSGVTATIGNGTDISLSVTITISPGAVLGTRTVTVTAAGLTSTAFSSFKVTFAPAENDNFSNATIPVSVPFSNSVDTTAATTESTDPLPGCGSASRGKSVWFRYTAPVNGTVTADTFGSSYDTVLSTYTGSVGSFTAVANGCNDDSSGIRQSRVSFPGVAGVTYFFLITAFNSDGGALIFNLTFPQAPPTLTSVTPNSGGQGGNVNVTLAGSNLYSPLQFNSVNGIVVSNIVVVNSTVSTATFNIATNAPLGIWGFTIMTTGGGTSNSATFTVNSPMLTVSRIGTGSGTVTSSAAGIDCGATCSATLPSGQVALLSAMPAAGSIFGGWNGDADCLDGSVTMTAPRNCTARFDLPQPDATLLRGDFDGDGKTDIAVYRPSTGEWFIRLSTQNYAIAAGNWYFQWGIPDDVPISGDFDGDGKTDISVYRPSTGEWFIRLSTQNYAVAVGNWYFQWGTPGDVPITGDFDHDSKTDIAVYRPSTGEWFIRLSTQNYAIAFGNWYFQWGITGDQPEAGDFDADGKTDIAVYRPSTGEWFIRLSTQNYAIAFGNWYFQWGIPDDQPVAADFDGDGKSDIAVYRPSTGEWNIRLSTRNYAPAIGNWYYQWGVPGDGTLRGDFDGDLKTDIAIYRPSTGEWFIRLSTQGYAIGFGNWYFQWGQPGDLPLRR